MRTAKILCTLQHEVYRRPVEETMDTPAEEPGGFHGSYLDRASFRPSTEWELQGLCQHGPYRNRRDEEGDQETQSVSAVFCSSS